MRLLLLLAAALAVGRGWAADSPSTSGLGAQPAYRSAFAGYRNFKDEPVGSWREANDAMGRLGGHMGHTGHPGMPASEPPDDNHGNAKSSSVPHGGQHGGSKP